MEWNGMEGNSNTPNDGMLFISFRSPANVDAAKEWRENYPEFKRKVARCVRKSQEDLC